MSELEESLNGGNINEVIKVGGTVRRSAKHNPFVYELLQHLEQARYPYSPRYLGIDEKGREILSYLDGDVSGNAYPEVELYMWSDEVLSELAILIRRYHDATVGFIPSVKSENEYRDPSLYEVICHNDAALYNVVFKDERPAGIIDFDMAGPGPRIWDIAYTLYTCVPLASFSPGKDDREVNEYKKENDAAIRRKRIKLFFSSYGIHLPSNLKQWVISRIEFMCTTLAERAALGDSAFIKLVEEGHLAHYEKEVRFLEQHFNDWW